MIVNASGVKAGSRESLVAANVGLVERLVEYCAERHCRFIQIGSAAEYGEASSDSTSETVECRPTSDYGESKLLATTLVSEARAAGIDAATLRLFNVVGRGQPPGGALGDLVARCRALAGSGEPLRLANFDVQRDYVSLRAVAMCVNEAVRHSAPPVVNVGTGEGLALMLVTREIAARFGVQVERGDLDDRRIRSCVADVRLMSEWSGLRIGSMSADQVASLAVSEDEG